MVIFIQNRYGDTILRNTTRKQSNGRIHSFFGYQGSKKSRSEFGKIRKRRGLDALCDADCTAGGGALFVILHPVGLDMEEVNLAGRLQESADMTLTAALRADEQD